MNPPGPRSSRLPSARIISGKARDSPPAGRRSTGTRRNCNYSWRWRTTLRSIMAGNSTNKRLPPLRWSLRDPPLVIGGGVFFREDEVILIQEDDCVWSAPLDRLVPLDFPCAVRGLGALDGEHGPCPVFPVEVVVARRPPFAKAEL